MKNEPAVIIYDFLISCTRKEYSIIMLLRCSNLIYMEIIHSYRSVLHYSEVDPGGVLGVSRPPWPWRGVLEPCVRGKYSDKGQCT